MPPSLPITPLSATAATRVTRGLVTSVVELVETSSTNGTSDGNGGLDAGVRVVALDGDVLEVERVELADGRVQHQRRQRPRVAGQLEPRLVEVVEVQVRVTQRVHEVAHLEVAHLGDHVGEQGVRRDVERHAEEDVGGALVELAGEPAARWCRSDVELE